MAIEAFFLAASGGVRFLSYSEIMVAETLRLIRSQHPLEVIKAMGVGWAEREEAAKIAKAQHVRDRETMTRRMQNYREPAGADKFTAKDILRNGKLERCQKFYRDLTKFIADPATPLAAYEAVWLMKGLISHSLSMAEAQGLVTALRYHYWEHIHVNRLELLLGSRWSHDSIRGQRPRPRPNYDPNDEIDRWRAAVALAYSDVFITDNYLAGLCRRAAVEKYSTTKVFSVKEPRAILDHLSQ